MRKKKETFKSVKESIDTIENLSNDQTKVSEILSLFKSVVGYLEAERNITGAQGELLHALNQSLQANIKLSGEFSKRLTKIENKLSEEDSKVLYMMCKG